MPHTSRIFFRLPHRNVVHQIDSHTLPHRLTSPQEVGRARGYVLAPFCPDDTTPLLLITPDEERTWQLPKLAVSASPHIPYIAEDQELRTQYARAFTLCQEELSAGVVEKLVLARQLRLRLTDTLSDTQVQQLFTSAAQMYPQAFVALIHTPITGNWLIATPEVLLEEYGSGYRTIALAATMTADEGGDRSPETWSTAHRHEQRIVADFIHQQLTALDIAPVVSPVHLHSAGHLVHLCTEFTIPTPLPCSLGDILAALHPTPAVCGYPAAPAAELLQRIEEVPRSYYAGFSGPIGLAAGTHLFVTLRCMHWQGLQATLFAGGGILPESQEEIEWHETNQKMRTLLQLL